MLREERHKRLLQTVRARGSLSVADAEKALSVSRMTVHRDLDALEEQGLVRKVHGGVVLVEKGGDDLFDPKARTFEQRLTGQREAKRTIARQIAKLVGDANSLLLDASSTAYFLSEHLDALGKAAAARSGDDLFVFTTGLPLFTEVMRKQMGVRVVLSGGEPHVRTGSLIGPVAVNSLRDLRFDYVVMSCLGVMETEETVFIASAEEVALKRAFMDHARQKILACDTTKFNQTGVYPLGPISDFDHVVTEKKAYTRKEFRAAIKTGTLSRKR